ncbi:hypothetical protein U2F10_36065 [Leptothoe sp. EHU-05/26/07-4]
MADLIRILNTDFLNPTERNTLLTSAQSQTGTFAAYLWETLPKREIVYYTGLISGLILWLWPLGTTLRPAYKLAMLIGAAGLVAASADALDNYQDELDDHREKHVTKRAITLQNAETVELSTQYAAATQKRLVSNSALPEHLVEADLAVPQQKEADDVSGDDGFVEFVKGAEAMRSELDPSEVEGGAAALVAASVKALPAQKLKFGTRTNPRTKQKERVVDLTGHTSYCGLPIVDLAHEIAIDARGCLVVAPTGCGKSELQKRSIRAQWEYHAQTNFTIFAHKNRNQKTGEGLDFAGMEDTKDLFVFTASQRGEKLLSAALDLKARLQSIDSWIDTGCEVPHVVVIDQTNQGIVAAANAQREANLREDYEILASFENDYVSTIRTGLIDGRTQLVKIWSFAHANTNEALGIGHQFKTNVSYTGMGRAGNYSAVSSPLKTKFYVDDDETRKQLLIDLATYLEAHKQNKSPVNVVVALTNAGHDGWRLIVLPQPEAVQPIDFSATNPSKDDFDGDGLPDVPLPSDSAPTTTSEEASPVTPSEARITFESLLNVKYTDEQKRTATEFVQWIKINSRDYVDAHGLIDPQEVWPVFPDVASPEELEAILNLIIELEGGAYEAHPINGDQYFRLKGYRSNRERYGATSSLIDSQEIVWKSDVPESTQEALTPEKVNPGGITDEVFTIILAQMMQLARGVIMTPSEFINTSNQLKSVIKLKVGILREVLVYLDSKKVVVFPEKNEPDFQFLGFSNYQ